MNLYNFSTIGLIYNFVGGLIYIWAILLIDDKEICQLSATKWNANSDIFKSLKLQKLDNAIGVILVTIGFLFQLLGNLNINLCISLAYLILWLLLPSLLFAYIILRRLKAKRITRS